MTTTATRRKKPAPRPVAPATALQRLRDNTLSAVEAGVKEVARSTRASLVRTGEAALERAQAARDAALATASEARERTGETVSHLEKVFEERVSRAIAKLGVPTSKDVRALSRQVAKLQASVEQLRRTRARA